jgi:hypothetical protein
MHPQSASWPARRIAWWALAAVVAVVWQGRGLLCDLRPPGDVVVDFYQEWASARNLLCGAPIYEPQRASSQRYLGCAPEGEAHFFLEINAHPPTTVLLGLPLARLDYRTAVLVWNLISLAALAASAWLVARQLELRLYPWTILPAIVFFMLCWPLRSHVAQGQLMMVLLLSISGAWAADRSGREILAGALIGAATVLKLFPALLFLHFVFRQRWRAVAAGLASIVVLTAATAAVLGPFVYATYFRDVPPFVAEWRSAWNNASLAGLWSKLFEPGTKGSGVVPLVYNPTLARMLVVVSCGAVIVLLARAIQQARSLAERDGAFGAAVVVVLLVTPVTWEHGFVLLLLPFAISWAGSPTGSLQRRLLILLAIVLMVLNPATFYRLWLFGDLPPGRRAFCSAAQVIAILSVQCYALLALFVMAMRSSTLARPATVGQPIVLRFEPTGQRRAG